MGYAYVLTPAGMVEKSLLTARFLKRKMADYEALKKEIGDLETELNSRNISENPGL